MVCILSNGVIPQLPWHPQGPMDGQVLLEEKKGLEGKLQQAETRLAEARRGLRKYPQGGASSRIRGKIDFAVFGKVLRESL